MLKQMHCNVISHKLCNQEILQKYIIKPVLKDSLNVIAYSQHI